MAKKRRFFAKFTLNPSLIVILSVEKNLHLLRTGCVNVLRMTGSEGITGSKRIIWRNGLWADG